MVEDHYPEGGLGAAVSRRWPSRASRCGSRHGGARPARLRHPGELMDAAGIYAPRIAAAARALVQLKGGGGLRWV